MDIAVTVNPHRSRYEITVDGAVVGHADYRRSDGTVVLPHTEIDPAMRGRGLAAVLVERVLGDLLAESELRPVTVVPSCWFVAEFIDANPRYAVLLDRS